jgi:3',5'-cyclic AMP phosphodiesterase CpdA
VTTFAHITDIHLSMKGTSWSTVAEKADDLLRQAVATFNAMDDLDFVMVTGDVLDIATHSELHRFTAIMRDLKKPWHFVPGNHDGYIDPNQPMAFRPHEAIPIIDGRMAQPRPDAQYAYWSREVAEGVHLIGLDSRYADHWNGKIEPHQREWLRHQLSTHPNATFIVAVHHPLVALHPVNQREFFTNFICDEGEEVAALLNAHEGVKVLVHGHHHANHIIPMEGWLHVGTASLTGYPCSYRLIEVEGDHVRITTHTIADDATLEKAREVALNSDIAEMFNADDHSAWVSFIKGDADDRSFEGRL